MFLRDGKVVDHSGVRHLDPGFVGESAVARDREHRHVGAALATGLVTEGEQLAGFGIDLRMRGEGEALQLAAEGVVIIERLERVRVEHHRRTVFLQRQQFAVVKNRRGVGGAAAQSLDARIVTARIAIGAEQ